MTAEQAVDGGAGVVSWLLAHSPTLAPLVLGLALLLALLRVGYNVALAWSDLRLRHRLGGTAGAATDWLRARGPEGRSGLYRAYMASPQWAERRGRTLMLAGGTCQRCGQRRATEAHHLTYDRLGRERDQDLLALCRSCHRMLHGQGEHAL
jgi:hypothetical protein